MHPLACYRLRSVDRMRSLHLSNAGAASGTCRRGWSLPPLDGAGRTRGELASPVGRVLNTTPIGTGCVCGGCVCGGDVPKLTHSPS